MFYSPLQNAFWYDIIYVSKLKFAIYIEGVNEMTRKSSLKNKSAKAKGIQLYPYQERALELMKTTNSSLLLDEMGLGKTVQALTHVQQGNLKPCLIIPPKSLVYNWADEIEKWFPGEDYVIFNDPESFLDFYFTDKEGGTNTIYIAWHDVLARKSELVEDIMKLPWKSVILDEAHLLRNPNTMRTRMLGKIENADYRLAITGTPIVNSAMDLYPLLKFVKAEVGTPESFAKEYTYIKQNGNGYKTEGFRNQSKLIQMLEGKWIRRTKAQVLKELPEKTEQELRLQLKPQQAKLYDQMLENFFIALGEDKNMSASNMLVHILRLKQLALDPSLIVPGYKEVSAKTEALLDLIQGTEGKLVVFSNFESYISIVEEELNALGIKSVRVTGQENNKQRMENVNAFQQDADIKVFLGTMQAGGVGLTLTAASTVVITDLWWNKVRISQAIDRCHRIGQKNNVQAITLHCDTTVDDHLKAIIEKKDVTAREVVEMMQARGY